MWTNAFVLALDDTLGKEKEEQEGREVVVDLIVKEISRKFSSWMNTSSLYQIENIYLLLVFSTSKLLRGVQYTTSTPLLERPTRRSWSFIVSKKLVFFLNHHIPFFDRIVCHNSIGHIRIPRRVFLGRFGSRKYK